MWLVIKLLRWFALLWLVAVGILMVIGYIAILRTDGWWAMMEAMPSPFNVKGFIVSVISISPSLGAWWLADYLTKREQASLQI